jgi:hypothetical protein
MSRLLNVLANDSAPRHCTRDLPGIFNSLTGAPGDRRAAIR